MGNAQATTMSKYIQRGKVFYLRSTCRTSTQGDTDVHVVYTLLCAHYVTEVSK